MNRRELLGSAVATVGVLASPPGWTATPAADARRSLRLIDGWRFHLGHASDLERDFGFGRYQRAFAKVQEDSPPATMAIFDDSDWSSIAIPHDWAVTLPFARPAAPPSADRNINDRVAAHGFKAIGREFPEHSVGWYRRDLPIEAGDRGKAIWLEFDGVFRDCIVYVNGCIAGENSSGYAPFRIDIADFVDYDGPNALTVRVDATEGEGWFYEGAGIYRHVSLVKAAAVHVPQWGTVVRAELVGSNAALHIETELTNQGPAAAQVRLRRTVIAPGGEIVLRLPDAAAVLDPYSTMTHPADAQVLSPQTWSIETPRLYRLVTEILDADGVLDRTDVRFGVRSIRFDPDQGFFLNDKPVKLLGTCNHQDHAGVGTGIPDRLNAWRVDQLLAMGSNAWRSSHNPPSAALLDICDEKGMLMIVELRRNTTDPQALGELDRVIRRDRNHPCVILWSTGNEEPQQGTERGARITSALMRRIKALDPTRPVTQAFYGEDKGYGPGAWNVVDVAGLNYRTDKADAFHKQFPHLPIIGTETGSTVATRGEYVNDAGRHLVRAYDTEYPFWASTAEQWWPLAAEWPWYAGGFIWTGFDYRGEPTPYPSWPSVSSQFGVLDLCGFPKDDYYYYRAWWRRQTPLVHLLPHWNWEGHEGRNVEVWAHSNCDEVELFVNGVSAGRKPMPRNKHLAWSIPYAPGRLEAFGYRGGRQVARDARETAGAPVALRLSADRQKLQAGDDLAILKAEVLDGKGRLVPRADSLIRFDVEGAGKLIGVGNGNPNSQEPDQAPTRRAFNGLCQALVRTGQEAGSVRVTASSPGLEPARYLLLVTG